MRILITGFVVFVIWSIFSVWLYIKTKPVMDEPVVEQPIPEVQTEVADSVKQPAAVKPGDLMFYFEFDDATVKTDSQTDDSIAKFNSFLNENPGSTITITGHTDNIGTAEYNQVLGQKRAESVKKYLEGKGIGADKIATESMGEDQPVANQTTEEGRAKNRRAVITIKN